MLIHILETRNPWYILIFYNPVSFLRHSTFLFSIISVSYWNISSLRLTTLCLSSAFIHFVHHLSCFSFLSPLFFCPCFPWSSVSPHPTQPHQLPSSDLNHLSTTGKIQWPLSRFDRSLNSRNESVDTFLLLRQNRSSCGWVFIVTMSPPLDFLFMAQPSSQPSWFFIA